MIRASSPWPRRVACAALLLAPAAAVALPPSLPPGLEQDVERMLGAAQLSRGCRMTAERIRSYNVDVEFHCPKGDGVVQLWPLNAPGQGDDLGKSRAFALRLLGPSYADVQSAAHEIAARVVAHDDGTFFSKAEAIRNQLGMNSAGGRSDRAFMGRGISLETADARARDLGPLDTGRRALCWIALLALIAWLAGPPARRRWQVPDNRRWLLGLAAIFVTGLLLRILVPPWAPLHANGHGIAELRGLAGTGGWQGPVESDQYGVAYRQVVRASIGLWDGGATSALVFAAIASALAVIPVAIVTLLITGSAPGSLLAAAGLALYPAHIALSPSESPMGLAGTLFAVGLAALLAMPALGAARGAAALWLGALALANASELGVVTLLLPVAALLLACAAHGRRLVERPGAWVPPAVLLGLTMFLHTRALSPVLAEAGLRRPSTVVMALLTFWQGHQSALFDSTLAPVLLLPLAVGGLAALAWRGGLDVAAGLLGGSLLLVAGSSIVIAARTDVIRYQPDAHLLLFVLVGALVPAIPDRRPWARPAGAAALAIMIALSSVRGLAAIHRPMLDATAYGLVERARPMVPADATIHIGPRRMGGGHLLNDFPDFLLASGSGSPRVVDDPGGPAGPHCLVWLGPACYTFTLGEVLNDLPQHSVRVGDAPLRDECKPLVMRIDSQRPPLASAVVESPFPAGEFHVTTGHALLGLFPCGASPEDGQVEKVAP